MFALPRYSRHRRRRGSPRLIGRQPHELVDVEQRLPHLSGQEAPSNDDDEVKVVCQVVGLEFQNGLSDGITYISVEAENGGGGSLLMMEGNDAATFRWTDLTGTSLVNAPSHADLGEPVQARAIKKRYESTSGDVLGHEVSIHVRPQPDLESVFTISCQTASRDGEDETSKTLATPKPEEVTFVWGHEHDGSSAEEQTSGSCCGH